MPARGDGGQLPSDAASRGWLTVRPERTMVVVARTVAALNRLIDILALTRADRRIQTLFTHDPANPARLGGGVQRFLDRIEAPVVTWREATRAGQLAIAASENDRLHQLRAPVLLVPHGAGYQKYYPDGTVVSGMNPDRLRRRGRVVPDVIALPHPRQRDQLRATCPPAADRSFVVGDPSLDRMLASRHRERPLRARFGARGKALVVVASTWGPRSLFGGYTNLVERLVAQLPADEYHVALIAHPGISSAHGGWQVRGWLSRAQAGGLRVIAPEEGWHAALTAATCVLSDQGSLSLYAAALDKPLLLVPGDSPTTVAGSALAALAARTGRLDPDGDLHAQVAAAIRDHAPGRHDPVRGMAFDEPGRCAQRLRPLIYDLLDLAEPAEAPAFAPVDGPSAPPPAGLPAAALVAGGQVSADAVAVTRYPDLGAGQAHDELDFRHLVVDADEATVGQLSVATILCTGISGTGDEAPDALLQRWPRAVMVATSPDPRSCRIYTREVHAELRLPERVTGVDPLLLASLAHVRLRDAGALRDRERLRIGTRIIEVVVAAGPASPRRF